MIAAIAARLREMNLLADAVVGLQIANTVEGVLTFMAVLRADACEAHCRSYSRRRRSSRASGWTVSCWRGPNGPLSSGSGATA